MKKIYLLALTTIASYSLTANVVYTDITDVTLSSGGNVDINFDNTGAAEFTISDQGFGGTVEPGIFFNQNCGFTMISAQQWDVMTGLTLNTTIDANAGFHNNSGDGYIDPFWAPNTFPTGNDTYIGAQFTLGTNTHFGWIRVNWDGNGTLIIKDYAYENTPNTSINAGDQGAVTGLSFIEQQIEFTTYPNPVTTSLLVDIITDQPGLNLQTEIITLMGQPVWSGTMSRRRA